MHDQILVFLIMITISEKLYKKENKELILINPISMLINA